MAVKSESNVRRKAALAVKFCVKKERNATLKKVYALLKKTEVDRSEEEKQFLLNCIDLVKEVRLRIERQKRLKERLQEVEDPPDVVAAKCICLAEALTNCKRLVVYTGAGVSTAACIPDYRGTNGIWTLLQQGKDIGRHDLTKAEPTLTHMALTQLYRAGLIKHVVSQNCDGLHLRSGLPKEALSEVHGNMYVEVCRHCQPVREYLRLFDVTENTARYSHRTGRRCYHCSGSLVDSIVHFGERGTLKWPLNWAGAVAAAKNADGILCIGSSLKVLKKYPWLWCMDKTPKKRPKLYIVNLQWTPKDDHAALKINAKCDFVMKQLMDLLDVEIPAYNRSRDPIFPHATPLILAEEHTTTKPHLLAPKITFSNDNKCDTPEIWNYTKFKNQQNAEVSAKNCSIKTENHSSISCNIKKEDTSYDLSKCRFSGSTKELKSENLDTFKTSCDLEISDKVELAFQNKCLSAEATKTENSKFGQIVSVPKQKKELNLNYNFLGEPSLEIIYEGVKLKVEENVSVQANVKIENDVAILCDTTSICQNSFIFNSSYELEVLENGIKFVHLNDFCNVKHFYNDLAKKCDSERHKSMKINSSDTEVYPVNGIFINENPGVGYHEHVRVNQESCKHGIGLLRDSIAASRTSAKSGKANECLCCSSWYGASKCLFYLPRNPVFRNSSVGVCECCTDESDDAEEPSESDKNGSKEESVCPVVKPISNPGWYGKGYRKRIKRKR